MVTNSPNCTNRHRSGYTCLELGKAPDECCPNCYKAGADNLLKAIFPDGPPERKDAPDEEEGDIVVEEPLLTLDLPASYPFDLIFLDKTTKEAYHEIHVTGPGTITIPPGKGYREEVTEVIVRYPDGSIRRTS